MLPVPAVSGTFLEPPGKTRFDMTSKHPLHFIFNPQSIAVIGASRRPEAVGHAVFKNLITGGYQGVLYPVNPKALSIMGVRCYKSVSEIPDPVDLAILIVHAEASLETFNACIAKGVKAAVIISAGFKEVGEAGALIEKQITGLARKNGIPLLGPNCLGLINTDPKIAMNASFGRAMPKRGRIAFISQSGALCTSVLDYAKGANIGFSKFISMGNKADVTELELLEFLGNDEETDVILMYLENLSHPREMVQLARKITGDAQICKPILAIKAGRTLQGAKAASSHTGALAGSDEIYNAIFEQGGILRVETVQELFDYAQAFALRKLPKGNRVAIVTNAGGPGIMTTDACVRYGLEMAEISEPTKQELRKHLPSTANFNNPIDVIGDAQHERYEAALEIVLKEEGVDAVIVILTPQAMTDIEEIAEVVGRISSKSEKPVLACFMGIVDVSGGVKVLEEKWNMPAYRFPESAARTLSHMVQYGEWMSRPRTQVITYTVDKARARKVVEKAVKEKRSALYDYEVREVLEAYGFPLLPMKLAPNAKAAGEAAREIGCPVVVKISSPQILHKIDVGGVALNIKTPEDVEKAAEEMITRIAKSHPDANILGVTVQKMAPKGREVILGLNKDPLFGPTLMFGLGGTYVEVMKDVTFRVAPIVQLSAQHMIHDIKSFKILEGVRGEKPADLEKIAECLQRLSQLAMECPEIAELDINPLFVYNKGEGCAVIDHRILVDLPPGA